MGRSVYLPAKSVSPRQAAVLCCGEVWLYSPFWNMPQGRHRDGHEVGPEGVARSELSRQSVASSGPEADRGDSAQQETRPETVSGLLRSHSN